MDTKNFKNDIKHVSSNVLTCQHKELLATRAQYWSNAQAADATEDMLKWLTQCDDLDEQIKSVENEISYHEMRM